MEVQRPLKTHLAPMRLKQSAMLYSIDDVKLNAENAIQKRSMSALRQRLYVLLRILTQYIVVHPRPHLNHGAIT